MSVETNGIATVNDVLTNLCVSAIKYNQSDSGNKLINKQNNTFNDDVLYLSETSSNPANAPIMPSITSGPQTHYINGADILNTTRPNGEYNGFVKNNYTLKNEYAIIVDQNPYRNTSSTSAATIDIKYSGVSENMLNTSGYIKSFSWMTFNVVPSGNLKCKFDLNLNPAYAITDTLSAPNIPSAPSSNTLLNATLNNAKIYITVIAQNTIILQKQISNGPSTIEWTSPISGENSICITLVPASSSLPIRFRCTPTYQSSSSYYLMVGFKYDARFYTNILDYTDTKCIRYSDISKRDSITLNWVLENGTNSKSKLNYLNAYYRNSSSSSWNVWKQISLTSLGHGGEVPRKDKITGSIQLPLLPEILTNPNAEFMIQAGQLSGDYDWYYAFNDNPYTFIHEDIYGATPAMKVHPSNKIAASLLGGYFNGEESTGQVYRKVWLKHD